MRSLMIIVGLTLTAVSGCAPLADLLQTDTTTVRLVNSGDYDVEVTLYIYDDQNILEDILTEIGTKLEYTVPAGETVSFSRDCDDLQAIVIDNAELVIIGEIGPETDSDVLRDGNDFGCGDTIVFTFTHSAAIVDFDVTTSVEDADAN